MRWFKRVTLLLLAIMMFFSSFSICFNVFAQGEKRNAKLTINESYKPKAINIVYDDSGSMVNGDEKDPGKGFIDRWAQAKYSLEIFVSMMDDEDVLNVFTMSNAGRKVRFSIHGSDRKKTVKDIHESFKTGDFSVVTPIDTLDSAYSHLTKINADDYDRWLVVITDGAFTGADKKSLKASVAGGKLNSYAQKLNNQLIYIPIDVANEYNYKSSNFTTYDKGSIRDRLLDVSNQIYTQRDKIEDFNVKDGIIPTGGISMSKLIILLQGDNVKLEGVDSGDITQSINVKFTEAADAVEYGSGTSFKKYADKIVTNKKLNGIVAIIEPEDGENYIKSDRQIKLSYGDKSNIDSGVVYYVPAVELDYSLKDSQGKEWISSKSINKTGSSISPGTYTLTADIIDAGTGKGKLNNNPKLAELALDVNILGNAYSLEELQNGVTLEFNNGEDLSKTTAQASVMNGKYAVDTSDFLNALQNCVVKITYQLKVKIEKRADKIDFKFKKVHFLLNGLKSIKDKKDMMKATVTCVDNSGNSVKLTDEDWAKIVEANNNGGVSKDGTAIYVGNPKDDKKTKVDYDLVFNEKINGNGEGEFFIQPKYIKGKDGKPDKNHTTHRNFIHKKVECHATVEINIPNVSERLAYSTTPTPVDEKSFDYIISISMWWTIGIVFLCIWILGYVFKKKLPKNKKGTKVNTEVYSQEYSPRRKSYIWKSEGEEELKSDRMVNINKKGLSFILPFVPQKGFINFSMTNIPKIEIKAEKYFNRNDMMIISKPRIFANLDDDDTLRDDLKYLKYRSKYLTEDTVKAFCKKNKKKHFILSNMPNSTFVFASDSGGTIEVDTLSFKNKRRKK